MGEKSIFLIMLAAVASILPSTSICLATEEVDWLLCDERPIEAYTIWPDEPTAADIISFAGPTIHKGTDCEAERYYGGVPTITIDHNARTIELWFEPPPPPNDIICITGPVCGLGGRFGPLAEGDWWFLNHSHPDLRLRINFWVSAPPIVELEDPNGGESFVAGSSHVVHWRDLRLEQEDVCPFTYGLDYSVDNGDNWTTQMTIAGRCSAAWTLPDVNSDQCLVRVYDISEPDNGDQSDQTFAIYQCTEYSDADYNVDCYVNGYDYSIFAWWWGFGLADMSELAELADSWLLCGNPFDPLCGE